MDGLKRAVASGARCHRGCGSVGGAKTADLRVKIQTQYVNIGLSKCLELCVLWACGFGQKIDSRRAGSAKLVRSKVETGAVGDVLAI